MVVIECVDFPLASFTPNGTWRFLLNADSDRGPSLSSQDVIWIVFRHHSVLQLKFIRWSVICQNFKKTMRKINNLRR